MRSLTSLLNVESVPRSLEFYCGILGFAVEQRFELEDVVLWARISHGDAALMLNSSDSRRARGRRESPRSYDDAMLFFVAFTSPIDSAAGR